MPDFWPLPKPVERKETSYQEAPPEETPRTLDGIGAFIIHTIARWIGL